MTLAQSLKQYAIEAAVRQKGRKSDLVQQLHDAEAKAALLKLQIADIEEVDARLKSYKAEKMPPDCPFCFVVNDKQVALKPIGGGTSEADYFRCDTCGHDLEVRLE